LADNTAEAAWRIDRFIGRRRRSRPAVRECRRARRIGSNGRRGAWRKRCGCRRSTGRANGYPGQWRCLTNPASLIIVAVASRDRSRRLSGRRYGDPIKQVGGTLCASIIIGGYDFVAGSGATRQRLANRTSDKQATGIFIPYLGSDRARCWRRRRNRNRLALSKSRGPQNIGIPAHRCPVGYRAVGEICAVAVGVDYILRAVACFLIDAPGLISSTLRLCGAVARLRDSQLRIYVPACIISELNIVLFGIGNPGLNGHQRHTHNRSSGSARHGIPLHNPYPGDI
jgi:hypothetical protein